MDNLTVGTCAASPYFPQHVRVRSLTSRHYKSYLPSSSTMTTTAGISAAFAELKEASNNVRTFLIHGYMDGSLRQLLIHGIESESIDWSLLKTLLWNVVSGSRPGQTNPNSTAAPQQQVGPVVTQPKLSTAVKPSASATPLPYASERAATSSGRSEFNRATTPATATTATMVYSESIQCATERPAAATACNQSNQHARDAANNTKSSPADSAPTEHTSRQIRGCRTAHI
jgi:hypothetical protein